MLLMHDAIESLQTIYVYKLTFIKFHEYKYQSIKLINGHRIIPNDNINMNLSVPLVLDETSYIFQ